MGSAKWNWCNKCYPCNEINRVNWLCIWNWLGGLFQRWHRRHSRFLWRVIELTLQIAAERVRSLFLASQIQKDHSIDHLLNFLIVFLMTALLKPSFLTLQNRLWIVSPSTNVYHKKFHTQSIRYYGYFWRVSLILVLCQDYTFSSYGHVKSIRINCLIKL